METFAVSDGSRPDLLSRLMYSGIQSFMATRSRLEMRGRGGWNWLKIMVAFGSTAPGKREGGEGEGL